MSSSILTLFDWNVILIPKSPFTSLSLIGIFILTIPESLCSSTNLPNELDFGNLIE